MVVPEAIETEYSVHKTKEILYINIDDKYYHYVLSECPCDQVITYSSVIPEWKVLFDQHIHQRNCIENWTDKICDYLLQKLSTSVLNSTTQDASPI